MEFFIAMCSQFPVNFPSVKNRKIQTKFSNGGVMLLRSADKKLNFFEFISKTIAKIVVESKNYCSWR